MNKFENDNTKACGSVAEEIADLDMSQDVAGGSYAESAYLGNKGSVCSVTLECQSLCRAIRWSSWAICK